MSRARLAFLAAAAIVAFFAALLAGLDRRLLVEISLLVLGALLLQLLVRAVGSREGRGDSRSVAAIVRARRGRAELPEPYLTLLNRVTLAEASAVDYHRYIRPVLRTAAAERLRARRIDLEREPDRARAALGDDVWELVRPDAGLPRDPRVRGTPVRRVGAALDAIERIR